jgi:sterol desaturase/sphingolipid hydroxylase (fatty acid hydroxylase superfamily)
MCLAVLLLDYLHDAWFYFTHRLLHWKPLYVHVHYIHHKWVAGGSHIARWLVVVLPATGSLIHPLPPDTLSFY